MILTKFNKGLPVIQAARVGIADRPFSRGLYPTTEREMEPAAYRGGGHLTLVINNSPEETILSKPNKYFKGKSKTD